MNVFNIDWNDLETVIQVAKDLYRQSGIHQIVIKKQERTNYNVTFAEREKYYTTFEVVFRTKIELN